MPSDSWEGETGWTEWVKRGMLWKKGQISSGIPMTWRAEVAVGMTCRSLHPYKVWRMSTGTDPTPVSFIDYQAWWTEDLSVSWITGSKHTMEWDAAAFELEEMDGCLTLSFRKSWPNAFRIGNDSVVTSVWAEASIYQTWDKHIRWTRSNTVKKCRHNRNSWRLEKRYFYGDL